MRRRKASARERSAAAPRSRRRRRTLGRVRRLRGRSRRRSEPQRSAWVAADFPPPPRQGAARPRSRKPSLRTQTPQARARRARAPPRPPGGRARRRSAARWLVAWNDASRVLPYGLRPEAGRRPYGRSKYHLRHACNTPVRSPPARSRMKKREAADLVVRRLCIVDSPRARRAAARATRGAPLGVVVQRELVRMRSQARLTDLFRHLVVDPGLDQVFGEDIALEQEFMAALEIVERGLQRRRH